ncbi:MAG TPA: hypothetical protein VM513_04385 [Kofleriaceae bacterium]|jgi:hypothetical protein|nr:hypothetical protein [Kofleriaceae bacterium]
MGEETVEREYMGRGRSKMWTYLILMVLFVALVLVINLVLLDTGAAKAGIKSFFGLPGWALATVCFLAGAIIFWLGLKMETDWPEFIGAFLITLAVFGFELIIGFDKLSFGVFVIPYLIPIVVFAVLMMYGMKKSA